MKGNVRVFTGGRRLVNERDWAAVGPSGSQVLEILFEVQTCPRNFPLAGLPTTTL